jgi:hypothetical protein
VRKVRLSLSDLPDTVSCAVGLRLTEPPAGLRFARYGEPIFAPESPGGRALPIREEPSSFPLPAPEDLPGPEAALADLVRFARTTDPTTHFRERWGAEYRDRAASLWRACVEAFGAGEEPPAPPDELLLCLCYDVTLGPHLGAPDSRKLAFLHWLVEGLGRSRSAEPPAG